jgi:hypothetical protein
MQRTRKASRVILVSTKFAIVESARTQLDQAARETPLLKKESNNQPHQTGRTNHGHQQPTQEQQQ